MLQYSLLLPTNVVPKLLHLATSNLYNNKALIYSACVWGGILYNDWCHGYLNTLLYSSSFIHLGLTLWIEKMKKRFVEDPRDKTQYNLLLYKFLHVVRELVAAGVWISSFLNYKDIRIQNCEVEERPYFGLACYADKSLTLGFKPVFIATFNRFLASSFLESDPKFDQSDLIFNPLGALVGNFSKYLIQPNALELSGTINYMIQYVINERSAINKLAKQNWAATVEKKEVYKLYQLTFGAVSRAVLGAIDVSYWVWFSSRFDVGFDQLFTKAINMSAASGIKRVGEHLVNNELVNNLASHRSDYNPENHSAVSFGLNIESLLSPPLPPPPPPPTHMVEDRHSEKRDMGGIRRRAIHRDGGKLPENKSSFALNKAASAGELAPEASAAAAR